METLLINITAIQSIAICFIAFLLYNKLDDKIYNCERNLDKEIFESHMKIRQEIRDSQRR